MATSTVMTMSMGMATGLHGSVMGKCNEISDEVRIMFRSLSENWRYFIVKAVTVVLGFDDLKQVDLKIVT